MNEEREYLRSGIIINKIDKKFRFILDQERYITVNYKEKKPKDEFIAHLQHSWSILNEAQNDLLEYVQRNYEEDLMLQMLETIYTNIHKEMNDILQNLKSMGSERNHALEEYDFDLRRSLRESPYSDIPDEKPLLPNYLRIVERFNRVIVRTNNTELTVAAQALKTYILQEIGQLPKFNISRGKKKPEIENYGETIGVGKISFYLKYYPIGGPSEVQTLEDYNQIETIFKTNIQAGKVIKRLKAERIENNID